MQFSIIKKVTDIVENSELVRMANKYFDSESTEEMVNEIQEKIEKLLIPLK